jgi:hypothetical protein
MDNETLTVIASSTAGRSTATCPWCGTVSKIAGFGMQVLPGCGHAVDVRGIRRRRGHGRSRYVRRRRGGRRPGFAVRAWPGPSRVG